MTRERYAELHAQLDEACQRVAKAVHNAEEVLTEQQLTEAFKQALLAGDFVKLVRCSTNPNKQQAVVYLPFNRVDELEAENVQMRLKLNAIQAVLSQREFTYST